MNTRSHDRDLHGAIHATDEFRAGLQYGRDDALARTVDALHDLLERVREGVRDSDLPDEIGRGIERLAHLAERSVPELRGRALDLTNQLRRLAANLASAGPSLEIPSRPLLGVLPLARVIPQDAHAMLDYAGGITCGTCAVLADDPAARWGSLALAGAVISVSALTDYRLSLAKVIPIEAHEATDYLWGAAVIAAPFVLGYSRREPLVTLLQVLTGASTILASLFTDYRAAKGVGRSSVEKAAFKGARIQPGLSTGTAH